MPKVYDPLTVRYRPDRLQDVVGQDDIIKILTGALRKNRMHRTYLITGPYGSGKTTIARCIARALNCENRKGTKLCGKCDVCKIKSIDLHMDVEEINAANQRGIDDIRALHTKARLAPISNFRIFIIDECHMLTPQAFQAALKLLEEPLKTCVYMLLTTAPEKLPKTIKSRCFQVQLDPVKPAVVAKLLQDIAKKEGAKLGPKGAMKIAKSVRGHPRDALNILEKVIIAGGTNGVIKSGAIAEAVGVPLGKLVALYLKAVLDGNLAGALRFSERAADGNVPLFLKECAEHLKQLVFQRYAPKLADSLYYKEFFNQKWRRDLSKVKYFLWAELIKLYIDYAVQAKTYTMEAGDLMSVVTLGAISKMTAIPAREKN